MSTSLILVCLWAVAANVAAMIPSRDHHWSRAYVLIAVGIPLLGFLTFQHGALAGVLALVAGMSVLRWPVIYLGRWLRRQLGRKGKQAHDNTTN